MNTIFRQPSELRSIQKDDGFTVIELLIATVIFSLVLLMLTYGVLQITRAYYKGVTSSNTQNTARNVLSDISQTIQFGGAVPLVLAQNNGTSGFCAGNQLFSYLLGVQLVTGTPGAYQANHVLMQSTLPGNCGPTVTPQNLIGGDHDGTELLGLNMRLSSLTLTPLGDLYKVGVRVVYGDSDLLCSPAMNDCGTTISNFPYATIPGDLTCKGQDGSQFCAVSDLSTIVQNRLQ